MITLSEDLSRDARKLLARLRSLLKLRNLLRLESTGGFVRSGDSEGMAVLLIGESGWVAWEGLSEREEDAVDVAVDGSTTSKDGASCLGAIACAGARGKRR